MVGFLPSFSPSKFRAKGIRLNGSSQYVHRGTVLSGATDTSEGTISFWTKVMDDNDTFFRIYLAGTRTSDGSECWISNAGSVLVDHQKTAVNLDKQNGNNICSARSNTQILADSTWHHMLISWKTNNIRWYLDGAGDGSFTSVPASGLIPYSQMNTWDVGFFSGSPDSYFNVEMSEVWFDTVWTDLTVQATRERWRTAAGKPADLGNSGQIPTGSQPIIYLSGDKDTFANNKGYGGSFSNIGSPTNSSNSPSD
jgi:hypothetical protein